MSESSPSLLNSLRRFQFQKRPAYDSDNSISRPSSIDKVTSQEESTDPCDSDYGSVIGSSGDTNDGSNTVRQPVVINITTANKRIEDRVVHTISDSEDEDDKSQPNYGLTSLEDQDDTDDVIGYQRSKTPKPIIVSDDDDYSPVKQESQTSFNGSQEPIQQQCTSEEPEIFIVDDDSNSVEIVSLNQDTKPDVKPEISQGAKTESTPTKQTGKRKAASESPQPKAKKKAKRKKISLDSDEEDNVRGEKVFDSDADSDEEISNTLTEPKRKVLEFLNTAVEAELKLIVSCTNKKVGAIMAARPFEGWKDLVTKLQTQKFLGTSLLNGSQQVIEARDLVSSLMRRCEKIASRTEAAIAAGAHSITYQPSILNPKMKLMSYQMVGLNWLNVMNSQNLSGILADEMGLGKTIQVISFLAHLKETGQTTRNSPHLIVVPASTLENWGIEFEKWCPSMKVEQYYGSQEERRWLRHDWIKNGFNDIEVILTTYSMVQSSYEERKMFRVVELHYVVFDEAHMLKNMNTQRYENLFTINALHRILLTGTPLQNNLLELMSLLVFVMPDMFIGKTEYLKFIFSKNSKQNIEDAPQFEQEQVSRAKRIMMPFILRRLKTDVLKDLPTKTSLVVECELEQEQAERYALLCEQARTEDGHTLNSMTVMMDLRRMANHPLTLRYHYEDETLRQMAALLVSEPTYKEKDPVRAYEDLLWRSDHELHLMVKNYDCLKGFELADSLLVRSGKFLKLDEILPPLKENGHRVLIFSQFIFVLDILEDYLRIRDHFFLRLDGSTPVPERQEMIDQFNQDSSIFVFLLSTKAGGLGINLTAADTVIIHDVDFNPYNDKQAEDRCHRMGQTRPVQIMRFVSKGTIEEAIMRIAQEKLHLEKEVTSIKEDEVAESLNVAQLLKESLGIAETEGS